MASLNVDISSMFTNNMLYSLITVTYSYSTPESVNMLILLRVGSAVAVSKPIFEAVFESHNLCILIYSAK